MSSVISLRPEMGETILAHLGKLAKLPKFGVVAGQAVASAIEDLWGAGGGVYNDLDVFIPSTGKFTKPGSKANTMPTRGEAKSTTHTGYGGSVQRHLELVQTYRIEEVRYAGLINRVYFRLPDVQDRRADDHAQRVISGFDINAVRVGIDLRTRKLVWDAHYEQFLANRELRIAACYTPAHTLVRLLKKAQELPDVTVDVETAARITAMLQTESLYRTLNSAKLVSYLFGDKFTRLAMSHESQWQAYYQLDDAWFHQATATGGWRPGSGDETSLDAKLLRRMTPRGELDAADQEFARGLGTVSVVALPSQVYRQRDTRRNGFVSMLAEPEVPEGYEHTHLPHYADVRGADYFDGIADEEKLEALRSFTQSFWGPFTMGWSGAEQLAFDADLQELETRLGAPDARDILLWAAHDAKPMNIRTLEALSKARMDHQRKPAHRCEVPLPPLAECPVEGAADLALFELKSERELLEFKAQWHSNLYEPESNWGHRYFVMQDPARPRRYAILQVRLDTVDVMSASHKLKHELNRYDAAGQADLDMFQAIANWLKNWWLERGHLFNEQEPFAPDSHDIPF